VKGRFSPDICGVFEEISFSGGGSVSPKKHFVKISPDTFKLAKFVVKMSVALYLPCINSVVRLVLLIVASLGTARPWILWGKLANGNKHKPLLMKCQNFQ
jgi:hypothetical protein